MSKLTPEQVAELRRANAAWAATNLVETEESQMQRVPVDCSKKKVFDSESHARRAHVHSRFRVRAYPCTTLHQGKWHVTAQDKRERRG